MPKAVVLFASPHRSGATARLLTRFLSGLQGDWQTDTFDVCVDPVHPCMACGVCKEKDGCAFRDLDVFDASLRESDLLIIASPVYNFSFPAQLKSVIDRFQRYFEARFSRGVHPAIERPRRAVLLLTMGQKDPFAVEVCEKTLRQSFSVMNTTLAGTVCLMNTDSGVNGEDAAFEKAYKLAIEITAEV